MRVVRPAAECVGINLQLPAILSHVRQYADTMVAMDGDEGDMAGYTFGASGFGDTIRGNLP